MYSLTRRVLALPLLLFFAAYLRAQAITIGTGGDYPTLEAAESVLGPGDTAILLDQIYQDGAQFLNNVAGSPAQPVVIMAQTAGQAIFRGGTEGIHLLDCNHVEINGLVFEQQTGNGLNADDAGDYSTPSTGIVIRNCLFRDLSGSGNRDFLKLSGVDSFLVENCRFENGLSGSGVDMVGCHQGTIRSCFFDNAGNSGIQAKGGTQFIRIERNFFQNHQQRALNLGGSTGLSFFRPPLSDPIQNAFEAADLEVFANIFYQDYAPVAYVGCTRVLVRNNTIVQPQNWVMRILQETTEPGFISCSDNDFSNNIVYLDGDLTEVNIGPNTAPETFSMGHNLWYNAQDNSWTPTLPVTETGSLIENPLFIDLVNLDFHLTPGSPAIGNGALFAGPAFDYDGVAFEIPPSMGAFEGDPAVSNSPLIDIPLISLFPNPTRDVLYIKGSFQLAQVQVYDVSGRMVLEKKLIGPDASISLHLLHPGRYWIRVQAASGKTFSPVMVAKRDE